MRAFQASGRSVRRERAVEDLLLELEAQDDVEVVGHLVRLDADQGRADRVRRPVEVAGLEVVERRAEALGQAAAAGS